MSMIIYICYITYVIYIAMYDKRNIVSFIEKYSISHFIYQNISEKIYFYMIKLKIIYPYNYKFLMIETSKQRKKEELFFPCALTTALWLLFANFDLIYKYLILISLKIAYMKFLKIVIKYSLHI